MLSYEWEKDAFHSRRRGSDSSPNSPLSEVLLECEGHTIVLTLSLFSVFWCFDIWGFADPERMAPPRVS